MERYNLGECIFNLRDDPMILCPGDTPLYSTGAVRAPPRRMSSSAIDWLCVRGHVTAAPSCEATQLPMDMCVYL